MTFMTPGIMFAGNPRYGAAQIERAQKRWVVLATGW